VIVEIDLGLESVRTIKCVGTDRWSSSFIITSSSGFSRSYWAVNGLQSRIVGDGLDFNQDRDCLKRFLFWAQHPEAFGYPYSAAMYSRRGAGVSDIAAWNLTCH
jgi:hypothetical protein